MMQKIIEEFIEENHINVINTDGYLMVSKEDLTKLLVKYQTNQLAISRVVVAKRTLCKCGRKLYKQRLFNMDWNTCEKCGISKIA